MTTSVVLFIVDNKFTLINSSISSEIGELINPHRQFLHYLLVQIFDIFLNNVLEKQEFYFFFLYQFLEIKLITKSFIQ